MKNILITFLFFILQAAVANECAYSQFTEMDDIYSFSTDVMNVTNSPPLSDNPLSITITKYGFNQGNGNVYIITDKDGDIKAIKIGFVINGKREVLMKTFDELKAGEKLEYFEKSSSPEPAMVLKNSSGKSLSPSNGGKFTFSVLKNHPKDYMHYTLYLRKKEGKWIVKNQNGEEYTSMDMIPNTSGRTWLGTFKEVNFE